MTTHEVLVKARNLIEDRGLNKHGLSNRRTGAVCARGALNAALTGDPLTWGRTTGLVATFYAAEQALAAVINPERPYRRADLPVVKFNNKLWRTKRQVLAAFDKAIAATAPEPDTSFLKAEEPVPA